VALNLWIRKTRQVWEVTSLWQTIYKMVSNVDGFVKLFFEAVKNYSLMMVLAML